MTVKYHISADGNVRQCRAKTPDSCRATKTGFNDHFDDKDSARKAYEDKQREQMNKIMSTFNKMEKKETVASNANVTAEVLAHQEVLKKAESILSKITPQDKDERGYYESDLYYPLFVNSKRCIEGTREIKDTVKYDPKVVSSYTNFIVSLNTFELIKSGSKIDSDVKKSFQDLYKKAILAREKIAGVEGFPKVDLVEFVKNAASNDSRTKLLNLRNESILAHAAFDIHRGIPLGTSMKLDPDYLNEYPRARKLLRQNDRLNQLRKKLGLKETGF